MSKPVRLSPRRIYLEQSQLDALLQAEDIVHAAASLWAESGSPDDGVRYVEELGRGPAERGRRRRASWSIRMKLLLDTDVLVDHLRSEHSPWSLLLDSIRRRKRVGYISVVTVAELHAGKLMSTARIV